MNKIWLLSGIPGSGKSTWARQKVASTESAIRISRDDIRFSLLSDNEPYFAQENSVLHMFYHEIKQAIKNKIENIYIDATHLNDRKRKELLNNFNTEGYEIVIVIFDTSIETCIERNNLRIGRERVPELTIRNMYKTFQNKSDLYEYIIIREEDK